MQTFEKRNKEDIDQPSQPTEYMRYEKMNTSLLESKSIEDSSSAESQVFMKSEH